MVRVSFLEPKMRTSEISARASVRETQDRTATRNSNTTPDHHSDAVQDEHRQQIKMFIFHLSLCLYILAIALQQRAAERER